MPDIEFSTKGADRVVADQEKIGKSAQRNYQLTAKEAKDLGRVEQKIIRDTETAREKYIRKLEESKKALAGNVKEAELLKRVEAKLAAEFTSTASAAEKRALKIKVAAGQASAAEKKLHDAVKDTDSAFAGAFSPAKLTAVVGGIGAIQGAFKLVTDELRAQQQLIDARASTQLSTGESRNVVLRNLVGTSPAEIAKVQKAAVDISSNTGVSEIAINNAMAAAISATGGNNDLAIKLVGKSAKFLKDKPGDIGDFAGSLGDLTRVTGSTDPNVSLGLLAKIGQLSRITSPKLLAANAAPGLIGAAAFGGNPQSSGALFAALTTGSGDATGATSGTAVIGLAQQLAEYSAGEGAFKDKVAANPELQKAGLLGRIRHLQSNPEAAKQFLDIASFEKKMAGPIAQLLADPRSAVRRDFEGGLKAIPGNAGLSKVGDEALSMFSKFNALEPVAGFDRTLTNIAEQSQVRGATDRLSTEQLAKLRTILMENGASSTGVNLDELIGRIKGGGTMEKSSAIDLLERTAQKLEKPAQNAYGAELGSMSGDELPNQPSEKEREQARLLREAVEQLKKSNEKQDRMIRYLGDGGSFRVGGD